MMRSRTQIAIAVDGGAVNARNSITAWTLIFR